MARPVEGVQWVPRWAGVVVSSAVVIVGLGIGIAAPWDWGQRSTPEPLTALEAAALPFVGLDARTVRVELGPPGFRLTEVPGEYWRYSIDHCELDLFLYPAGEVGAQVEYARYRPTNPETRPDACTPLIADATSVDPTHTR